MTKHIYQYGLGDILFFALMQREKLISTLNFNVLYFSDNRYFQYPDEELKLRIELLKDLGTSVNYMESNDRSMRVSYIEHVKHIKNFKLPIDRPLRDEGFGQYIVFHTKLRPAWEIVKRIDVIKNMFRSLCESYKSKYRIVILGERNLKKDLEVDMLSITTIYDELMLLKNNNDVIDLTDDIIIPDYERLKKSIDVIRGAVCNICFGHGGAFCLSITYSKLCIAYIDNINYSHFFNINTLRSNNVFLHSNFNHFKEHINL